MSDLLLDYRRRVAEAVTAAIDTIDYSHADLLRRESVDAQAVDVDLLPAAVCLYAAEALGAEADASIGAATALALLETMADVFSDIANAANGRQNGLLGDWGMPRTLNAGDALFVLAQQRVLYTSPDVTIALRAAEIFDVAARDFCELLPSAPAKDLIPAALSLAALTAGLDMATAYGLTELGSELASGRRADELLQSLALPAAQRDRLQELASYLSEVRGE